MDRLMFRGKIEQVEKILSAHEGATGERADGSFGLVRTPPKLIFHVRIHNGDSWASVGIGEQNFRVPEVLQIDLYDVYIKHLGETAFGNPALYNDQVPAIEVCSVGQDVLVGLKAPAKYDTSGGSTAFTPFVQLTLLGESEPRIVSGDWLRLHEEKESDFVSFTV